MKTTAKDVILLCKGWYDRNKYPTKLDALKEYYRKYYSTEYEEYLGEHFLLETVMKDVMYEMVRDYPDRLPRFVSVCLDSNLLSKLYGLEEDVDYKTATFYRIVVFLSGLQMKDPDGKIIPIDASDYFGDRYKLKEDII